MPPPPSTRESWERFPESFHMHSRSAEFSAQASLHVFWNIHTLELKFFISPLRVVYILIVYNDSKKITKKVLE